MTCIVEMHLCQTFNMAHDELQRTYENHLAASANWKADTLSDDSLLDCVYTRQISNIAYKTLIRSGNFYQELVMKHMQAKDCC